MLWISYWIVALTVASGVSGFLIAGDLRIARYAAKNATDLRGGAPSAGWLGLAVFVGVAIGVVWPIAIFILGVTRCVRAHDDNAGDP